MVRVEAVFGVQDPEGCKLDGQRRYDALAGSYEGVKSKGRIVLRRGVLQNIGDQAKGVA